MWRRDDLPRLLDEYVILWGHRDRVRREIERCGDDPFLASTLTMLDAMVERYKQVLG